MSVSFGESERAVAVAGGGPTGLMLAAELALAGTEVAILERRPGPELAGSRAGGLHARAIELLDQRGIADRFLAAGETAQVARLVTTVLDLGDFPTRHPYGLALWQNEIERLLREWVGELGVPVHYGQAVTGFAPDEGGVEVELTDGGLLRVGYLVGCDGGRSVVRKAAGIEFPGWEATVSKLIAEVELAEEPEWGMHQGPRGISSLNRIGDDGSVRVLVTDSALGTTAEPTLADLSAELTATYGTDYGVHSPTWISRFTDATRQAASYREGRVLLAGDAAHVHYPAGGQGLCIGLQDAVNLGWKLARVAAGTVPDSLLDSYGAERQPATARSLRWTMALTALQRPDPRIEALGETLAELAAMDEPRRYLAALASGLDNRYDLGEGHPLLGRRVPDLELITADGPLRVYSLLHQGRPALLNLGEPGALEIAAWADRVQLVEARYEGEWELPAIGVVPAPSAALVRPDGHVAWVGDDSDAGLAAALTTWLGPAAAAASGGSE